YDALAADPGASADAIAQALDALNKANLAEANANAAYLAASAALTAAQAAADATQSGIDGVNAMITAEQLAQKQLLLTAAREKLMRQKTLLTAQVAVNDAAVATENALISYQAVFANTASAQAQKDAAALSLRHAGGALEAARYLLSIQNAINESSDVLADATASAADKLAAQNTLNLANLAYAEALSLQAIYSNAGVPAEALDLADALLSAQGIAALAESAYALDPSATNLSALSQAKNTLQAAKDALNAWNVYLPAHETSQTAQALNSAIEQAALNAATAQSILDAYATLASWSATAAEKSAAKALIASYGLSKTQAKAALAQANTDKANASAALNALLTQHGLASVQAAIFAESAARTALDTAEAALNAFAASNEAQQGVWNAQKRLDEANTQYGVISSLIGLKNAAVGALAAAQTAMETACQNWVDARLAAGTDEDAAVQTALTAYLAAQEERDEKSAALDAVNTELAQLTTLSEAQDEINSADAALTLAEQALVDALAAQPSVTQDAFGADFAADDATGVELPTIRTGGNLTLYTGGNAGTVSEPLTLDAAGTVLLQASAGGTVSLASAHSLQLGGITGGTVTIAVNGSIKDVSPAGAQMITADKAILYAIGGNISGSYVKTNINYFSGFADAIYLENLGALELGPVAGYIDGVFIISGGAITQSGGGFLHGLSVVLNAGGDIGTPSNPVLINTQSLTANGGNLYLSSIGHLNTVNLSGENVVLKVGGNLSGGNIRAKNLTLMAFGSIGSANNPLRLVVPGALVITSQYGEIYYTNQLIRSTFLVSLLLAGASRMMLLIRFGQTIQGGLVILNILLVKLDDLSGIGDTLHQAGIRSLDMALIENAGESSAALIKALQTAFPKANIATSMLLWLAQMRASIAQDDWNAMLNDLETIYRATTAEALTNALEAFTARWQEAYPEITARLNQEAADLAGMLETFAVMRQAGLELTMLLNSLSDALAQTNLP
ncbi:MAG: transposase, partial [Clostridiaceae bacterium]